MTRGRMGLVLVAALAFVVTACGGGAATTTAGGAATTEATTGELTPIRLQLQWVTQAQFAGYFAAAELGFYEDEGLDVTILDGGPDVVPQQVGSSPDGPEFTISWVPKVLEAREAGSDLVRARPGSGPSGGRLGSRRGPMTSDPPVAE